MKSSLCSFLIIIILQFRLSISISSSEPENAVLPDNKDNMITKLQKEKRKLEKSVKKLKENITKLKESSDHLTDENTNIKKELNKKNLEINDIKHQITLLKEDNASGGSGGSKNMVQEIKDIVNQMGEYHTLFNQMEIQSVQEKNLREEIEEKIKEIDKSQFRIVYIFINSFRMISIEA
jgi:septal ring factor EnvC (AmiA/AmiB activator)